MKKLLVLLLLTANAQAETPYEHFPAINNTTNTVDITWEYVDDIETTCNAIRANTGGTPYPYAVQACSRWSKNIFGKTVCTITTSKNPTYWNIGHEVRHCFQGNFHQ